MENNLVTARISLREVNTRASTAQHIVTGFSRAMPNLADLWQQIIHSLSDVPILTTEITRLLTELLDTRMERANLAAAGRATIAAYRDGERDPLSYLRDELTAQGFTGQWRHA
jgi:hypothetical protein